MRQTLLAIALALPLLCHGQDSLRVVRLLEEGALQPQGSNLMLFYGKSLAGTPYVASTLEVNPTEQLVVNLREMDCTTFVENCVALTLTTRQGSCDYDDFKRNLTAIRYQGGKLDGYASRNHYFTQWITSNEELGIVQEIKDPPSLFCNVQDISLRYMSSHPNAYPMLRSDTEAQTLIRQHEREASGASVSYIPRDLLYATQDSNLGEAVRDGDILAIVTNKDGLDTSHLGIAIWGDDHRLHLLNASQIHKKVIIEPMTLYQYMGKHPTQLGIRVVRLK